MLLRSTTWKKNGPTLTFRSAIFGDGLILCRSSMWLGDELPRKWRNNDHQRELRWSDIGRGAVSPLFHIAQGKNGMVNPIDDAGPGAGTCSLGTYHLHGDAVPLYMLLYLTQLAGHWR